MQHVPADSQCTISPASRISLDSSSQDLKVTLRQLLRSDVDYFYTWASDPEVAKSMTWEAYTSKGLAEEFLKEVVEKHPWFKAICVNSVPVGSITLTPGKGTAACRAELGYVLAKPCWGKGIATAAVRKALESGFQDLGVSRIEAFVDPLHVASRRVLEKSGMVYEGLLSNYLIFKGAVVDRVLFAKTVPPAFFLQ